MSQVQILSLRPLHYSAIPPSLRFCKTAALQRLRLMVGMAGGTALREAITEAGRRCNLMRDAASRVHCLAIAAGMSGVSCPVVSSVKLLTPAGMGVVVVFPPGQRTQIASGCVGEASTCVKLS